MEEGLLLLTYDDIIQPSVYTPTGITIQNAAQVPSQSYTLTGGYSTSTESLGFVIRATITGYDLLRLKHRIGLATSTGDTYISADTTVTVASDGSTVAATGLTAVQATSFIQDATSPNVTAFTFNLTTGILSILADEPIDPASLNPIGLTLQNSPNDTGYNFMSVTLTGGSGEQSSHSLYQIEILLTNYDLNRIKQMLDLATDIHNIYLSIQSIALSDFGDNGVNPVSAMAALDATEFEGDLLAPSVSQFILDLDTGSIRISFNRSSL